MEPIRLQKIIAQAGIASRREAEKLIAQGRVTVNGAVVTRLGSSAVLGRDDVQVDGQRFAAFPETITLMLNKPAGYICSSEPSQGKTVFALIKDVPQRLFTIGRLDKQSEGLLLLTNDGDLTHQLTHPRYEHRKIYEVSVSGIVVPQILRKLNRTMLIDGHPIKPATVKLLSQAASARETSVLQFTLSEGRNRQIRKMCDNVGLRVRRLCRLQMGPLQLGTLASGHYRRLTEQELAAFKATTP